MTRQNTGTNLNTTNIFKYFASKRNKWHYMKVLDRKLSTLKTAGYSYDHLTLQQSKQH